MAYTPTVWANGDVITADKLNKLENGVANEQVGPSGPAGSAATVTVGSVTTGEAGTEATVTNSGTESAAILDFVIPKGAAGTNGTDGAPGADGAKGDPGAVFTPAVSPEGELSWTNNGSLDNPDPVNIKGPKGDAGEAGTPGATGAAGASIKAIELYTNEAGGVTGGKATLTDNSEITITVTTAPAG